MLIQVISRFAKTLFSSSSVILVSQVIPLLRKRTSFVEAHGLDLHNLRGQGYDGGGNMSGKTNGAAAIISSGYPLAMYLHCASRTCNLCIAMVKSLDVQFVWNVIGVLNKVSIFFL